MHLEFTITAACPLACSYCPQEAYFRTYAGRPGDRTTSLDDYRRMLANVAQTTSNIDFSGYTEALYNPQWFEILSHTIDQGYSVTLFTTLGGASLDELSALSSLPIARIYVHLLDRVSEQSRLMHLVDRCHGRDVDLVFIYFDEDGSQLAADLAGRVQLERWTAHSRAGLLDTGRRYVPGPVRCCEDRHFCNVVLPNGDVHICCMDFALRHKIGNLLQSPLLEIQHSEAARAFREEMASPRDSICNHCIYAVPISGPAADNPTGT